MTNNRKLNSFPSKGKISEGRVKLNKIPAHGNNKNVY